MTRSYGAVRIAVALGAGLAIFASQGATAETIVRSGPCEVQSDLGRTSNRDTSSRVTTSAGGVTASSSAGKSSKASVTVSSGAGVTASAGSGASVTVEGEGAKSSSAAMASSSDGTTVVTGTGDHCIITTPGSDDKEK